MKHLTGLFVLALAITSGGFTQGFQSYTFENIKWLSAPAVVASKLEAAGYTVDNPELDEKNRLSFSGSLLGNRAMGTAYFGEEHQLLKLDLAFLSGGESRAANLPEVEVVYTQLRDTLFGSYGPPTRKATRAMGWFTEEISGYVGGILLEVTGNAEVVLAYESPRWAFHLAELQGEGIDAF